MRVIISKVSKILIGLSIAQSVAFAQGAPPEMLSVRPDFREARGIEGLPDNPFQAFVTQTEVPTSSYDIEYQALKDALEEEGLGGLMWHTFPENRMIMFGSYTLREGQVIPSWLAANGPDFKVEEIGMNKMLLEYLPLGSIMTIEYSTRKSYTSILEGARPSKAPSEDVNGVSNRLEFSVNDTPEDNAKLKKVVEARRSLEDSVLELNEAQESDRREFAPDVESFTEEEIDLRRDQEDELPFLN